MEEIIIAIQNDNSIKLSTQKIYINTLKEYFNLFGNPITQQQETIFNNIVSDKVKETKIPQYTKTLCKVRKLFNLETNVIQELYEYINKLADTKANKSLEEKKKDLMDYEELYDNVNEVYSEYKNQPIDKSLKKPKPLEIEPNVKLDKLRQYIILKLLIQFNTRNQDLLCKLINDIDNDIDVDMLNKNNNYLILNDDKVLFLRNNYKTATTYGVKKDYILKMNSKRLYEAIKDLIENSGEDNLIPTEKQSNLSRYIVKMTFGLGETNIMKIVLGKKNTLNQAKQISHNRGTALTTLQSNYNIYRNNQFEK